MLNLGILLYLMRELTQHESQSTITPYVIKTYNDDLRVGILTHINLWTRGTIKKDLKVGI